MDAYSICFSSGVALSVAIYVASMVHAHFSTLLPVSLLALTLFGSMAHCRINMDGTI